MNPAVVIKTYDAPALCKTEILRYAGCKDADSNVISLLESCVNEAAGKFTYRVCYRELPVRTNGNICDFDVFRLRSSQLASNLKGCKSVIVFAATVGVEIDRLIAKYGRLSPSKALMFQAIGTERIEALCNTFCADMARETHTGQRPRFSPGYGDLPLSAQEDIFAVLDCGKRIGLTLNDSLLMSPSKSVTAFVGIGGNKKQTQEKCSACPMTNCTFRGDL